MEQPGLRMGAVFYNAFFEFLGTVGCHKRFISREATRIHAFVYFLRDY